MRVIVTGANGFIGRNCIDSLRRKGHEVIAFCHNEPLTRYTDVEYVLLDLFNEDTLRKELKRIKATHLLHLAWCVEHNEYMHSNKNLNWLVNSIDLLERFVEYGGIRAVTAGTCAEYDWSRVYKGTIIPENFPKNPRGSLYSASKYSLGNLSYSFMSKNGLSSAHGRVFFLFGCGEGKERLIPSSVAQLRKYKKVVLKDSCCVRDFLYVKDVSDAFSVLLDSDVSGPVNISSGEGITIRKLVELLDKLGGFGGSILEDPISEKEIKIPQIVGNNELLRSLGWRRNYSIEEAITDYYRELGL